MHQVVIPVVLSELATHGRSASSDALAPRSTEHGWLEDRGYVVRDRPDAGLAVALVGNSPVKDTGDGFVDVESTDAYRDAVRCGATIVRIADLTGWPDAWRALGSR